MSIGADPEKTDLVLKMRRSVVHPSWAMMLKNSVSGRLGIAVRQSEVSGHSTLFAWMDLDQARRIHKWLGKFIKDQASK